MEKRYQVFLSSTYTDLKEERQSILQALMEMDCIPAGMELFPASDEDQWEFIKKVINDCDYYLLILGGRYGSMSQDGISYTEKEYDYAVERGIRVIALIHSEIEKLPFEKVEANPEARALLTNFRDKVQSGRLVKFWTEPKELPGLVALNLQKTIKMYPAEGWVRAGSLANHEALQKITELQSRIAQMEATRRDEPRETTEDTSDLASGADVFQIAFGWVRNGQHKTETADFTWDQIFSALAPYLISPQITGTAKSRLSNALGSQLGFTHTVTMTDATFHTISHQLAALGLVRIFPIQTNEGVQFTAMQITDSGQRKLNQVLAVKKPKPSPQG